MNIVDHIFTTPTRTYSLDLYSLGDLHVGALNCAEKALRVLVNKIKDNPNARWIGGGDLCDNVQMKDSKRFDVGNLPDWLLNSKSGTVKYMLGDIVQAQRDRLLSIIEPINDKCLGLIEGNHEFDIYKHYGRDVMDELVKEVGTVNLTDCAFIRLIFRRTKSTSRTDNRKECAGKVVTVFVCHGQGGGRTAGAEPNKLTRLAQDKDCDILLTGHSHSFCILPPIPMLYVPRSTIGTPTFPRTKEKYVANWGAMMYTYAKGPSTYASRANYPVRPMYTVITRITPFTDNKIHKITGEAESCGGSIEMEQVKLHDQQM